MDRFAEALQRLFDLSLLVVVFREDQQDLEVLVALLVRFLYQVSALSLRGGGLSEGGVVGLMTYVALLLEENPA